jgi:hypothetical protein
LNQFINSKAKPVHQVNKPANLNQMEPIQSSYPSNLINQTQKINTTKLLKKKKKKKKKKNTSLKSCKISTKSMEFGHTHFNQTKPIIPMITKQSPNSKFQRHIKKQQNQLNCAKASPNKQPKSKNHFKLQI